MGITGKEGEVKVEAGREGWRGEGKDGRREAKRMN